MERMKHSGTDLAEAIVPRTGAQIKVFSELVNRLTLGYKMGVQYEGSRDLYKALGYKEVVGFRDFYNRYTRQAMAKAIIDRPVKATWSGDLDLIEPEEAEDTAFEEAWDELDRTLGLKTMLSRVDRLTGIGRYGVLLLGLNDVTNQQTFSQPATRSNYKLIYLKPFGEETAKIDSYEVNPKNERYGKPLYYSINIVDAATQTAQTVKVHYTRIIHITDDNLESDVFGTPRLEPVFNNLMDLDKVTGGDAEMFWRGARPGYHGKLDPEFMATEAFKEKLQDDLDEYEHNLRRFIINEGVDLKALEVQISDPTPHVDVILQNISAETGIPKRVLTGTERGELASTQDTTEWLSYVQARREDHAEPRIVRPVVDRFIELGILPSPTGETYQVKWADLFSISEKARVEIGTRRAESLRNYTYNAMAGIIIPPDVFLEKFLGFTKDEITMVQHMRDEQLGEEVMDIVKDAVDAANAPPPPPVQGVGGKPMPAGKKGAAAVKTPSRPTRPQIR